MDFVKRGSTNATAIKELQKKLNKLGYNLGEDGIFGKNCESAVKDFQQKNKLGVDGKVGDNTWSAIDAAIRSKNETATQLPSNENKPIEGDELISKANLKAILGNTPDDVIDKYHGPLNEAMSRFNINTPLRMAHFISQLAHESNGFKARQESLYYSSAERLQKIFGKYFKTIEEAQAFTKNSQLVANRVYANRMGNGGEASGDGFKYRGHGLIQLTDRENYTNCSRAIGIDILSDPELLVNDPSASVLSAVWYWDSRNCNNAADTDDVKLVTKKINGGFIGLKHRKEILERAKQVLLA